MKNYTSPQSKKYFLPFLFLLVTSILVRAQEINTSKLNEYLHLLEANNKFIGSVAISKSGKVIFQEAYGYENVANQKIATANTKYFIGSISKTFIATLIMKAVESGKLKLDQSLASLYPELPNSEMITIDHLLRHRSGVRSITSLPDYYDWRTETKSRKQLEE